MQYANTAKFSVKMLIRIHEEAMEAIEQLIYLGFRDRSPLLDGIYVRCVSISVDAVDEYKKKMTEISYNPSSLGRRVLYLREALLFSTQQSLSRNMRKLIMDTQLSMLEEVDSIQCNGISRHVFLESDIVLARRFLSHLTEYCRNSQDVWNCILKFNNNTLDIHQDVLDARAKVCSEIDRIIRLVQIQHSRDPRFTYFLTNLNEDYCLPESDQQTSMVNENASTMLPNNQITSNEHLDTDSSHDEVISTSTTLAKHVNVEEIMALIQAEKSKSIRRKSGKQASSVASVGDKNTNQSTESSPPSPGSISDVSVASSNRQGSSSPVRRSSRITTPKKRNREENLATEFDISLKQQKSALKASRSVFHH